jgi:hypothetical protein
MRKIYNFGLFLEAKKNPQDEVKREVRKIISEFFVFGKNIQFSGDQNGEPKYVEFEINKSDYGLDYSEESMKMEYSEGVLSKRNFEVSLVFSSKTKEGTDEKPIYKVKFKIKLKPILEIKTKKEDDYYLVWTFENKPNKIINYVKNQKKNCKWDNENKTLFIKKSVWNKLATKQVEEWIEELEGEKLQNKKI